MATVTEDARRVRVNITEQELNTLLVQPARDRGFIDFDPTRINTRQMQDGTYEITYERTEAGPPTTRPGPPA